MNSLDARKLTFCFLAITCLLAPLGRAVLIYNSDDLFIGFHQTGNTTADYAINIGQAATFRDATGAFTLTISATAFAADMQGAFGASWRTSGDILWGVVGTTQNTAVGSDPIRLLYVSEPLSASAPSASSSQSGPANAIIAFKNNWQSTGTQTTVANSATEDPTTASSWTGEVSAAAGPFQTGAISPFEDGLSFSLDLYRTPQTTTGQQVTNEGRFTVNFANDTISFVPTPEPSPISMLCVAVLWTIGFGRIRRGATTPESRMRPDTSSGIA